MWVPVDIYVCVGGGGGHLEWSLDKILCCIKTSLFLSAHLYFMGGGGGGGAGGVLFTCFRPELVHCAS